GVKMAGPFTPGARVPGKVLHKGYEHHFFELSVERMEAERLFSWRWHPHAASAAEVAGEPTTLVVFELEEAPGGTMLTVVESGFDQIPLARRAKALQSNDAGWTQQMKAIEEYLRRTA